MAKSSKIVFGVLTIGIIVAFVIAGFVVRGALAAAINQQATPTQPAQQGQTTTNVNPYTEVFWKALASSLGVDEAKLKSAVISAIGTTLSQEVKDGKLTQAQADQLQQKATQGMNNGTFGFFPFGGGKHGWGGPRGGFGFKGMVGPAEFAKVLGVTEQDLMTELSSGKSLNQIATEHQKIPAQVKATVLSDLKTQLDTEVKNGNLTQSQADSAYQNFSSQIDSLMSATGGHGFFGFRHGFDNDNDKNNNNNNSNGANSGSSRFFFPGNGLDNYPGQLQ
ncbi:MAG: hypothetical protein ACM3PY_06625 [Omnitrophica WOR_2 bacterium]